MTEIIQLDDGSIIKLFGRLDENIELIQKLLDVTVRAQDGGLAVIGDDEGVQKAVTLIDSLSKLIKSGHEIDKSKIRQSIDLIEEDKTEEIFNLNNDVVTTTAKGKQIRCKTLGQRNYVRAIKNKTIVFGIGPAGTGKTYLAVALAVSAFKAGEVEKIILTRPAIEAGEKLGFLPGDLQTKVDPYLRPLYDALRDMFGVDSYVRLIERGIIEIAPLAYMRGRTLSSSFIILDEAQNTTEEQMKMFLTRLGENSKMVITGDDTQIDLPFAKSSGLISASKILTNIEEIEICRFTDKDVVRHELVQKIVLAYEKALKKEE
ncbi:MAG: PhoH family protein [Clostridiales bacterium]|nr:PhoH family protein [Clostridiales bacterium]